MLTPPTPHPAVGTPALHLHATPAAPSVAPVCDRRIAPAPTLIERSDNSTRPNRLRPSPINHPSSVLRRFAAFTLIELLVVVAIIALLAGLVVATVGGVQKSSVRNKAQAEVEALSRAIENYKLEIGSYPPESPVNALYNELTGNGTVNQTKVYFEPPRSMVTNSRFIDPWGNFYNYEIDTPVNVGLFDIFSTAGQANATLYIRN